MNCKEAIEIIENALMDYCNVSIESKEFTKERKLIDEAWKIMLKLRKVKK